MRIPKIAVLQATAGTMALGLSLAQCATSPKAQPEVQPTPSPHTVTAAPAANRETQPQPKRFPFPDCGDGEPPCITYDDGDQGPGMYLISSTKPLDAVILLTCDVEDYPTLLPCVLKHQDPQDRWITLR